ncbi:MAG: NrfD/PsrC family molybdoenzyme membrane anchor subunit [Candidatus Hadarchaeaceae archaeon]
MRKQDAWGWEIAVDTFLGGAGAGLYASSFLLGVANVSAQEFLRYGLLLGPILLLVGLVVLFAELGKPARIIKAFANIRSSWMSVGGVIQTIFIICALGYSLPMFGPFSWLPWGTGVFGLLIGTVGLIAGILVLLYHGFLFGDSRGVPLWSTPILQPLFLFVGLSTGLAALFLIGYGIGMEMLTLQTIGNITLVFLAGEGIVLWAFLMVPSRMTYELSVMELKTPANLGIMGGIAIILPAVLFATISLTGFTAPGILAGLLILIGGFYLRHIIIKAGRYYPSRINMP